MLRGEVWRYQVGGMRERVVVLTKQLDAITPDSLASLDARLAAALDH
ncbi:MAG: hypothetical protein ACRDTF_04850 [Pseudonocardiaceae bacterium]